MGVAGLGDKAVEEGDEESDLSDDKVGEVGGGGRMPGEVWGDV